MKKLAVLCLTLISCGPVEIIDSNGVVRAVDRDFIMTKTTVQDNVEVSSYRGVCSCTHVSFCWGFNYNKGSYDYGMHLDCPGNRPCEIKQYVGTFHYRYLIQEQIGESWEGHSESWTKQWQEQINLGDCR